jgi:hypothetical protein
MTARKYPAAMKEQNIKEVIKDRYGKIARGEQRFCCPTCGPTEADQCLAVGYTQEELKLIPELAVLGVGCGNPTRWLTSKKARPSWTWAPAPGSTSSWRPKKWGSEAGPSAWT